MHAIVIGSRVIHCRHPVPERIQTGMTHLRRHSQRQVLPGSSVIENGSVTIAEQLDHRVACLKSGCCSSFRESIDRWLKTRLQFAT